MSDNVITLKSSRRDSRRSKDQEPDPNARLRWLTELVQTILDAQTINRPSSKTNA
jgi:hypothetical protein